MASNQVKVTGLREVKTALQRVAVEVPAAVVAGLQVNAGQAVKDARPRVPRRTGRARASYRVRNTKSGAQVEFGGPGAPYVPWLEFGGRVGRKGSVRRKRVPEGRYLYPALVNSRDALDQNIGVAVDKVITKNGL